MSFVEPYLGNALSVVGKKSKKQAAFHPGPVQPPTGEASTLHFLGMKSQMVISAFMYISSTLNARSSHNFS